MKFFVALALVVASPAIAGVVSNDGILPGAPPRRRAAEAVVERAGTSPGW